MHERGPEVDFSFLQLSFLGLEQLVSNQAETLVLVGDRAYRVLVTEFIFILLYFIVVDRHGWTEPSNRWTVRWMSSLSSFPAF